MKGSDFEFAYLDSSVILRVILDEPNQLSEFKKVDKGVTSLITKVECLRTIDRLRVTECLGEEEIGDLRVIFFEIFKKLAGIQVSIPVIEMASQPLGYALRSLDSIHLASARLFQFREKKSVPFFSHDLRLASAARSLGMEVFG